MKPIYAYGYFIVSPAGDFHQIMIYEYVDIEEEFAQALKIRLDEELESMRNNMQSFLDEEIVKINGVVTKPKVVLVNAGFRGSLKRPYIEFLIHFRGDLTEGYNTYENIYESETTTYDYSVVWVFPPNFEVIEADVGVKYEIKPKNVLRFSVKRGFKIPGYEKIVFRRVS
ncbi:MAG: hypothetical protein QN229_03810 [Desulfurococcaceae archaeon TW002]